MSTMDGWDHRVYLSGLVLSGLAGRLERGVVDFSAMAKKKKKGPTSSGSWGPRGRVRGCSALLR